MTQNVWIWPREKKYEKTQCNSWINELFLIQMFDTKCMDLAERKKYEKTQCNSWINELFLIQMFDTKCMDLAERKKIWKNSM